MNSLDLKKLAQHEEFRNRVEVMLISIGLDIVGEPNDTLHTVPRQAYGINVLNNPAAFVDRFAKALISQPNIAQNININEIDNTVLDYTGAQSAAIEFDAMDIEIKSVISAVYNDIAGITSVV